MITVRPITEFDTDYLDGTRKDFKDGWNKDMIRSAFKGGLYYGFIAQEEGKNLGYITFSANADFCDIESVFVESGSRRHGIGKLLMDFAVKEIKMRGIKRILLEVRKSNLPAVNLYVKCGFKNISVRKKYYDNGEDATVMFLEIL